MTETGVNASRCVNCKHFKPRDWDEKWLAEFEAAQIDAKMDIARYERETAEYEAKPRWLQFFTPQPDLNLWLHTKSRRDKRLEGKCTYLPQWQDVGVDHSCSQFTPAEGG